MPAHHALPATEMGGFHQGFAGLLQSAARDASADSSSASLESCGDQAAAAAPVLPPAQEPLQRAPQAAGTAMPSELQGHWQPRACCCLASLSLDWSCPSCAGGPDAGRQAQTRQLCRQQWPERSKAARSSVHWHDRIQAALWWWGLGTELGLAPC